MENTKALEVARSAMGKDCFEDEYEHCAKIIQTAIDEATADLRAQCGGMEMDINDLRDQLVERDAQLAAARMQMRMAAENAVQNCAIPFPTSYAEYDKGHDDAIEACIKAIRFLPTQPHTATRQPTQDKGGK